MPTSAAPVGLERDVGMLQVTRSLGIRQLAAILLKEECLGLEPSDIPYYILN